MELPERIGINRLDSLERMRSVLGHRLLNIAAGIKAATGYLAEHLEEHLSPSELEYFPLIAQQCDEVSTIVSRMNALFGQADFPERRPLRKAVENALETLDKRLPGVVTVCRFEAESPLLVCPKTVQVVLEESVRNAREVSHAPVEIVVIAHERECVLRVIDQGPGFCEESAREAFEMFFTTRSRSMGLGLAIARRLVQEQGGRVALGNDERGNFVEFMLPLSDNPCD